QARWDELQKMPFRASGPGIPLGDVHDQDAVVAALSSFFADHPGLIGVDPSQLVLRTAGYASNLDMWYVDFDRMLPRDSAAASSSVAIWRGGITARVRHGELVMFGIATYPAVSSLPAPTISQETAERTAQLEGPAGLALHTGVSAKLV